jgi:hypothetical protein
MLQKHCGKFMLPVNGSVWLIKWAGSVLPGNPPLIPPPAPRQMLWMLLKPERLKEIEQEVVERLIELSPEIREAVQLAGHYLTCSAQKCC